MKMKNLLRRHAATVAVMACLVQVTGCGAVQSSSAPQATGKGPGNSVVAKGGAGFDTADTETAKLGSDAAPGVFPRTVKHANGSTTLKARPQRIVILDTGEMDALTALGIKPVGMAVTKGANPVPDYLAKDAEGIEKVGDINNINLEVVARLKPDLIISSKLRHDKLYTQLSQIAPTVFSIRPGFPWKENFRLIADTVGEEEKATAVMNQYSQKVTALRKEFAGTRTTVSLVRFMPGRLRLYGNKSLVGVVLKDVGIPRPAVQDVDDLAVEISAENISQADADLVLWSSYGDPAATGEKSVVEGASWKAIPAVKEGRAHRISDDTWYLGLGPVGAMRILDQLGPLLKG